MDFKKICLASDNFTATHPSVLEALKDANESYAPSYGLDIWTQQAEKLIQKAFKTEAKVLIVPTGTTANVLSLKILCRRFDSVICTDIAHLHFQECGAAESIVGCKLLTVPAIEGKITPEAIQRKIQAERAFIPHSTFPRILTITQPTEVGTVYTLEELEALSQLCKQENLLFHMDACRIYNAAVHLDVPLDAITRCANVDILSLGGTKNGLMCAEAVLIFNPDFYDGADHLHKQNLGLVSKMRYLSAQFIPFFKNGLWQILAEHANQKAQEIAAIIKETPYLKLSHPVETNQIFFSAPAPWITLIQEKIFCYPWNKEKSEIRFIASWNTTEKDVEDVRSILHNLATHHGL